MIKIAINGFGRIGRPVFRRILDNHHELEVAAINDLTEPATLAHLLKYDSVYGPYKKTVKFSKDSLLIDGKQVRVLAEKDPVNLPWKELGVDVVLECTGVFRSYDDTKKHILAGAKKVIISAPSKDPEKIPSYVLGVNAQNFDPKKDEITDMGSCTTNCLAPVAKVLHENFKIVKGFMTTIHSYTNDQRILDLSHKDLRRARAAALNIIPTTTGAAKAISQVMPELKGKLDGISLRVPTPTVSVLDLICQVQKETSAEEVNYVFKKATEKPELKGILGIEDAPLVSSDYIGNSYSAIVDSPSTMVSAQGGSPPEADQPRAVASGGNGNLVKVLAWYDNEYAYACRLAEFAEYVGKKL